MQHKDLNSETATHYLNRIAKVQKNPERHWGTMTPAQMLAHVRLLFEGSLGELLTPGNGQIPFRWIKGIALSGILPMPKNRVKAPRMFILDDADNITNERERLENAIRRFLVLRDKEPDRIQVHGLFGSLTMAQWARFHGLHLNHHLEQFGL